MQEGNSLRNLLPNIKLIAALSRESVRALVIV